MRNRSIVRAFCAVALLACAQPALAQPAPKKPPAGDTSPTPVQPKDPEELTGEKKDTVPPEEEPVAPVPVAAKRLASWREAVVLASAENTDYSISILEVDRFEGIYRQTLAGTLPTITAQGSVTFNLVRSDVQSIDFETGAIETRTVPSSPTAMASVSVRQPLIAPRTWWAIGTAQDQVDLAKTSVEDRKRILIGSVADGIVTVVTAERQAEVNRVSYKAAQDRLRLMKKRKELGAGSDLDIVRFQQDLVVARSTLVQGDEVLRQARERLALALGTTGEYGVEPDISIDDIQDTLARACGKGDLADRADIRALRQQVDISERAVTDADLLYAPTADVVSQFSYSSEDLVGDKNYAFSIQGVLTVPIWDGGARYGVRRSAVAVVKEQEERLKGAERAAKVEITQSDRSVIVAQETLAIAEAARDLAKQTDDLTRRAFEEGAQNVTSFDLVDASRRLREAEVTVTLRELELVRAKISAMLATSNCSAVP
ncbi:MAG: TolC family protein [Polyangiaceae bacterium]|nr:TolC family protein [Polyangiaceae bacterium]